MAHSDNQLPFTNFLLNLKAQRIFFEPCTYNRSTGKIDVHLPSGKTVGLDREQFNVHFGGRTFIMDAYNERTSRDAWEAFTQGRWKARSGPPELVDGSVKNNP